ncbi:hypothetical protein Tco_1085092 [Tanacetum coccineum]
MDYIVGLCAGPFSWGPAPGGKGACIIPSLANVETLATSDKKEQTALRKAIKARIVRHLLVDVSDKLSRRADDLKRSTKALEWLAVELARRADALNQRADSLEWRL